MLFLDTLIEYNDFLYSSNINIATHRHQIFDDIHVWKGVDFGCFACVGVYFVQASQCVASIDVHGTGATDT